MAFRVLILCLAIVLFVRPVGAFRHHSQAGYRRNDSGYRTETIQERLRLPLTSVKESGRMNRLFDSGYRLSTALRAAVKFKNFEEMLQHCNDKPVLVSFHTRFCGPCKLIKKELRAVRDEIGDQVHVFAVDTEKCPSLSARYEIAGLPTVLIFYQGEILHRVEGVETAENLVHRVKTLM